VLGLSVTPKVGLAYRGRTLRRNKPPSRKSCQTSSRLTSSPGSPHSLDSFIHPLYIRTTDIVRLIISSSFSGRHATIAMFLHRFLHSPMGYIHVLIVSGFITQWISVARCKRSSLNRLSKNERDGQAILSIVKFVKCCAHASV